MRLDDTYLAAIQQDSKSEAPWASSIKGGPTWLGPSFLPQRVLDTPQNDLLDLTILAAPSTFIMGVKGMQLFSFAAVAMMLASWPVTTSAGGLPATPYATHFHDCCMAAFSWPAKGAGGTDPRYAPVDVCEKDGVTLVSEQSRIGNKSGCEGGSMFVCSCMQPWIDTADPTLAYGFAAYNIHDPDGTSKVRAT